MIIKKILKGILILIAALVVCIGGLLAFLTATEYKPADVENLDVAGNAKSTFSVGDQLTALSWNIGYGALGDNADFFLDGGKMVKSSDEDRVMKNMETILSQIEAVKPDVFLLQEVDRDSDRSYNIDETGMLRGRFAGFESTYGINYKTPFVPYPVPPLGKIDAGIMTFTSCHVAAVERVQLPVPFKWPIRAINLKRCVTKTHIPIYGSDGSLLDRELILYNLHLEAYDRGAGKIAQTKMLAELLKKEQEKGNYVIAGGDFNQIFSTADENAFPAQPDKWLPGRIDVEQFGEGWQFLMDERVPSCRSLDQPYEDADKDSFQYYLIDGFIVSYNVQVETLETLDLGFKNSDHNPVVLKFKIN